MQAGGSSRYIAALIKHFGPTILLADIDQEALDKAAIAILPHGAADYRNRAVYAPVSVIMSRKLGDKHKGFRRPEGAKGREKTDFLWPADAFAIIDEADKIDREFGLYLRLLLYTGMRKNEGLSILSADVQPEERAAYLQDSKNEDPRMLQLREDIVAPLRVHLGAHFGDRLFRFNDGGHFKHMLLRATMAACGLDCPKRRPVPWRKPKFRLSFVGFHTFRHTWATWMRRYGGTDVQGLVATNNWRDPRSAQRYTHVVAREEWALVEKMPSMGNGRGIK
jgi:integrase